MTVAGQTDAQLEALAALGRDAQRELDRRTIEASEQERTARDVERLSAVADRMGISVDDARKLEGDYHGTLHLIDGYPKVIRRSGREQGSPYPATYEYVSVKGYDRTITSQLVAPPGRMQP